MPAFLAEPLAMLLSILIDKLIKLGVSLGTMLIEYIGGILADKRQASKDKKSAEEYHAIKDDPTKTEDEKRRALEKLINGN